jgi:type I restriction enzyme S subunit
MIKEQIVPMNWVETELGKVIEFKYGKALPAKRRDNQGYPVYGSNGIVGYHSEAIIQGPALIIGRKGSIGEVHFSEGPCSPIDTTYYVDEFHGQDPIFWLNFLRALPLKIMNRAVALPGLNRNEAYALKIKLPPPNEQKRIANRVESLQVKTAGAKKALETTKPLLDKLRQSILASAFRGDLTADWRKKNPKVKNAKKVLETIVSERETVKKNSQTRYSFNISTEIDERFIDLRIPSNWVKTNVDSVSIYIVDCAHSTPKWTTSGRICLRTTNFLQFKLILDEVKYVSNETFQNRIKRLKPQNGDVLYSREGGILGIACILDVDEDVCLGQRMMMFRPSCSVLSKYFSYYLNSPIILKHVKNLISGSAAPHINIRDIKKYPFPLPPFEEQEEIVKQIDRLFNLVDKIEKHHQETKIKVDTLSKSILAKAFQGELVSQDPSEESASELFERMKIKIK